MIGSEVDITITTKLKSDHELFFKLTDQNTISSLKLALDTDQAKIFITSHHGIFAVWSF